MRSLPLDIQEALIEAVGDVFYFRDVFRRFVVRCGVPAALYERHADKQSKRAILRSILADLEQLGDEGWIIQRRVLSEFCALKRPPEGHVDPVRAARAIHMVKTLAREHDLLVKREKAGARERIIGLIQAETAAQEKRKQMANLRHEFTELIRSHEPQERGYAFERLIAKLFRAHGFTYREAYVVDGEQLDGHFELDGFDYLVETRWRSDKVPAKEIGWLSDKAAAKLESTRGLFISMAGFTKDAREPRRGKPVKVILMDGEDLALVIEGYVDLREGLKAKIRKAAQEGVVYYPLRNLLHEGVAS